MTSHPTPAEQARALEKAQNRAKANAAHDAREAARYRGVSYAGFGPSSTQYDAAWIERDARFWAEMFARQRVEAEQGEAA